MALIRWTPFGDMEKFFDDELFPKTGKDVFTPPLDVYEEKDSVVAEVPLAGIDPEKVEISIENDVLTVKGESEEKKEVKKKNYYRKEVHAGSFFRSVTLPVSVEGSKAVAESKDGLMIITVPKAERAKAKKIPVKVKKK